MRVGIGYDVHAFDPSRKLVLGGIVFPGVPGLVGHSDADVICHAVADALLGAAALGDIGQHFPNTDPKLAGISSLAILNHVAALVMADGYAIANVDAMLIMESPKIAGDVPRMREAIAGALEVAVGQVSVKATTNEGLGTIGRGEGAACMAVACLASLP